MRSVLLQDGFIWKLTSVYIDDIFVNENILLNESVNKVCVELISKDPECLKGSASVLGLEGEQMTNYIGNDKAML